MDGFGMKDDTADKFWEGLDISTALRILRNAGLPDPIALGGDIKQQLQMLINSLCNYS